MLRYQLDCCQVRIVVSKGICIGCSLSLGKSILTRIPAPLSLLASHGLKALSALEKFLERPCDLVYEIWPSETFPESLSLPTYIPPLPAMLLYTTIHSSILTEKKEMEEKNVEKG